MESLKKIYKPIVFTFILFLLLLVMSKWFIPKSNVKGNGIHEARANGIFGEEKNTIDVLVIGDSESFTSISPLQIWKKYGFTMYNGGVSKQYLVDTYDYLNKVLEYQSPKVVLLEANAIYRNMKLNNIMSTKSQNILPILQYHDRWKNLNSRDFTDKVKYTWTDELKGFYYNVSVVPPKSVGDYMKNSNKKPGITKINRYYLNKIVDKCKDNNITIVLYTVPSILNWSNKRHDEVMKYADSKNIDYLDLNLIVDDLGVDWNLDSRDGGDHLNYNGAVKITEYMGTYLYNLNILPNHKDDAKYDSWNKSYELYERKILNTNNKL
mgnify:CR=1 FL=1